MCTCFQPSCQVPPPSFLSLLRCVLFHPVNVFAQFSVLLRLRQGVEAEVSERSKVAAAFGEKVFVPMVSRWGCQLGLAV